MRQLPDLPRNPLHPDQELPASERAHDASKRTFGAWDSIGLMTRSPGMSRSVSLAMLFVSLFFGSGPLRAQMPFYTDDTSVTPPKTLHVEIFDEFDGLHARFLVMDPPGFG